MKFLLMSRVLFATAFKVGFGLLSKLEELGGSNSRVVLGYSVFSQKQSRALFCVSVPMALKWKLE
ncbi:hypothetical protein AUJ65_01495 [Candidatus Micrarchaeota archaeon CG1_02_51_15]|nr:MAG: hypothetical protein AUJ65_01495 [Candidatus Micrarchaeota archaeon CG1_02_51_15]